MKFRLFLEQSIFALIADRWGHRLTLMMFENKSGKIKIGTLCCNSRFENI